MMLVLFLVPVVVFTTGSTGQAAVVSMSAGPAKSEARTFNLDLPRETDIRCAMVYGLTPGLGGGTWSVHPGAWCEQKMIPEWGEPDIVRNREYTITIKGQHEDGASTEWDIGWSVVSVEDGWFANRAMMGQPSAPVSKGWQMHEICVTTRTTGWGLDTWAKDCQPSSLATDEHRDSCDLVGHVSARYQTGGVYKNGAGAGSFHTGRFQIAAEDPVDLDKWRWYAVTERVRGGTYLHQSPAPWNVGPMIERELSPATTVLSDVGRVLSWARLDGPAEGYEVNLTSILNESSQMDNRVVGMGIYRLPEDRAENPDVNLRTPTAGANGFVGYSNYATCAFYWGEKVWDDEAEGGSDEPLGPLPTGEGGRDSDAPDVPAPPSEGDPWWLSLFQLIKDLIKAVASIPGVILDGLKALFVPDSGFFAAQGDRVSGALDETSVGEWMNVASSVIPASSSASGCAGPTVTFPLPGVADPVVVKPLDACDGVRATMATASTGLIYATVGFFGLMACIRALGSGFGWRPGAVES